jgi:WhiB family redox-sensing transcriptional regulator
MNTSISPTWRDHSYCLKVDPELFFNPETEAEATALCYEKCPVRLECLQWALEHKEKFGVWGGTTEKERRQIATPRVRMKCPHCSSTRLYLEDRSGVCLACGLSWIM